MRVSDFNNIKRTIVGVSLLVMLISLFFFMHRKHVPKVKKTLRMSYTLKNTSGEFIPTADFSAMLPAEIEGYQHIRSIESSQKYNVINEGSAQSIKFQLTGFAPFSSKVIAVTIVLDVADGPKTGLRNKDQYLRTEKFIERDSVAVKELSFQLKSDKKQDYLKSSYEWLVENIQDTGYVSDNKGAQYAIEKKMGDCTEHAYAFVALARAQKIPARAMGGFVVSKSAAIISAADYHNWAEFYSDGQWTLVDSQRKIFDKDYSDYIVTRILSSEAEGSSSRFITTDSRISVTL